MGNNNTHIIEIAVEKLHKLAQTVNRESAKTQGFFDGRFGSRVEDCKKKSEYLKIRRDKHSLKRI